MFAAARGSCHPPHPVETRLSETLPATIANVPASGAAPESNSSSYQAYGTRMGTAREARKTRKRGSRSSRSCHRAKKMDLPTSFVCQGPSVLIAFTCLAPARLPHPTPWQHIASNSFTRYRPCPSPSQFSASPDLMSRMTTFLRRELRVWVNLDVEVRFFSLGICG